MIFLLPKNSNTAPVVLMKVVAESLPRSFVEYVYDDSTSRKNLFLALKKIKCAVFCFFSIAKSIRTASIRGFHSSCFIPDLIAFILSFCFPSIKFTTTVHSCLKTEYTSNYPYVGWLIYTLHVLALSRMDCVVCISHTVAKSLPGSVKTRVIYNSIPDSFLVHGFSETPQKNNSEFRFLVVSALTPVKNVKLAILSYIEVAQPGDSLTIAGVGPCKDELEEICFGRDDIKFLGYVSDIERLYSISHCLLIPSVSEGFCLAFLEGVTKGLPIVSQKLDIFVELKKIIPDACIFFAEEEGGFGGAMSNARRATATRPSLEKVNLFRRTSMINSYRKLFYDL